MAINFTSQFNRAYETAKLAGFSHIEKTIDLNAPMASLPYVIFQFAMSPYHQWQALAWIGALIITFAVLALSIVARSLTAATIRFASVCNAR